MAVLAKQDEARLAGKFFSSPTTTCHYYHLILDRCQHVERSALSFSWLDSGFVKVLGKSTAAGVRFALDFRLCSEDLRPSDISPGTLYWLAITSNKLLCSFYTLY